MKALSMIVLSVVFAAGLSGCGKTLGELRANGDAIVDNSTTFATTTLGAVATIVKKVLGVGIAVYDMGKKIVEDSKDNVGTVVNTVTGASETPAAPTK